MQSRTEAQVSIFGIDYAFQRPSSMAALRSASVEFVCRYLAGGRGGSKEITKAEAHELSQAAIPIVLVWETTSGRAKDGAAAGVQDARDAMGQARTVGSAGPDRRDGLGGRASPGVG
jgi:hypothetical protein